MNKDIEQLAKVVADYVSAYDIEFTPFELASAAALEMAKRMTESHVLVPKEPTDILKLHVTSDMGLYSLRRYLDWSVGEDEATLDGSFDAKELMAIAQHMLKATGEGEL